MAGAGFKTFNTGDVLTAADVNTYLQQQVTMVFASAAARTTALSGVLAEGMMSYLQDTNSVEVYNGSSWVNVGNAGDITEVQAGTGISVASGTGPIPVVTNTVATTFDAKGDLVVGTGADTFAKLSVGTNGHTLVADSAETTGLKWQGFMGCQLEKSTSQAITTSTRTLITWDVENYDTDSFHNNSSNTSRITIPSGKGGYYRFDLVGATYNFTYWEFRILKNGVSQKLFVSNGMTNGTEVISTMFYVMNLAAGDYVEWDVWQNAGSNRNVITYSLATATYLGA